MIPPHILARASFWFAGLGWRDFVILGLVLICLVQTVRIEGLQVRLPLIGAVGPEGFRPKAERLERVLDGVKVAQEAAHKLAAEQKAREESELRELAKGTDDAIEQGLRDELARARDFIARNRVRDAQGRASGAAAPAPDRSAGHDGPAGQAPELDDAATGLDLLSDADRGLVVVPADDVLICTANTILAEEWRAWGLALEARGRD